MTPLQLFSDGSIALGLIGLAVVGAVLVAGAALYLEHRREVALIESGAYDAVAGRRDSRAWVLGGGLLLLAVGIGQLVEGFASTGGLDGLTVALVGAAAVVYYGLKRRQGRAVPPDPTN